MSGQKQFKVADALDASLKLFLNKGYAGTSLAELELSTGLNKSSIYNTFGSKDGLYHACLERFRTNYTNKAILKLEHHDFQTAIFDFCNTLYGGFDQLTSPMGCVATLAAMERGPDDGLVGQSLKMGMKELLSSLEQRCLKGVEDGQLSPHWDCAKLAAMVIAVSRGAIVLSMATGDREVGLRAYQCLLEQIVDGNGGK